MILTFGCNISAFSSLGNYAVLYWKLGHLFFIALGNPSYISMHDFVLNAEFFQQSYRKLRANFGYNLLPMYLRRKRTSTPYCVHKTN